LTGKVVDEEQQPISFANITLFSSDSETFIKGTCTADNYLFGLPSISEGNYVLKVSFIGFKTVEKVIEIKKKQL